MPHYIEPKEPKVGGVPWGPMGTMWKVGFGLVKDAEHTKNPWVFVWRNMMKIIQETILAKNLHKRMAKHVWTSR